MNEESYATRLVSWNVNGLRAVMKKGFPQIFSEFGADVVALQETKLQDADRAKLDEAFGKSAQELLSAGIEVGYSKEVKTGFKVGAKEGGYYISFSDADFDALLGEYLREKVSDMLFKA